MPSIDFNLLAIRILGFKVWGLCYSVLDYRYSSFLFGQELALRLIYFSGFFMNLGALRVSAILSVINKQRFFLGSI